MQLRSKNSIRNKYLYPLKQKSRKAYYNLFYKYLISRNQKHVFRLYGMKRSGNHAIVNWLFNSINGTTLLCNDIRRNQNPKLAYFNQLKISNGIGGLICSYENQLSSYFDLNYSEEYFGPYSHYKNVFLLRDPFNLFASRFVWNDKEGVKFKGDLDYRLRVVDHWKENAKTFLEWQKTNSEENIPINYNNWCVSLDYRNRLIQKLGLSVLNANTDKVPAFGGGSSFDGMKENAINKQKYSKRFEPLIDDVDFRSIFLDEEIVLLSEEIFGKIENSEMLYRH